MSEKWLGDRARLYANAEIDFDIFNEAVHDYWQSIHCQNESDLLKECLHVCWRIDAGEPEDGLREELGRVVGRYWFRGPRSVWTGSANTRSNVLARVSVSGASDER